MAVLAFERAADLYELALRAPARSSKAARPTI
jgi:hypothetical protein